ncbi:MAG: ATP phosphoribosyltransferase [Melioribacteraceae bacterium]|nr:ATP phosphoribosyltransferase [Melioribacteraceae bacterium]
MANGNLKLAIQKSGRLTEKSLQLLRICGIDVENYKDRLFVTAGNFNMDILFLRDDDIPEYVQDGVADIGFVGENVVLEKRADIEIVKKLGYSRCNLRIGIPEDEELRGIKELSGKTIATSYPNILKDFLDKNKIEAKVIQISGSVEITPSLGIADYICDLVSTGTTLKMNKLKKSFSILDSEAVLIKNKNLYSNHEKNSLFIKLLTRIESALNARNSKYLMMNIPKDALENIVEIIPSLKSPTILNLADESMLAVQSVIPAEKFWEINDKLHRAGATDILLLPIENIIL